jgi:integrase
VEIKLLLMFFPPPALPGSGSNGRRSLNRHLSRVKPTLQACKTVPRSKIVKTLWELKKDGQADITIKGVNKRLETLAHYCNLDEPERVKTFIATYDRSDNYKRLLANAYDHYVKVHGLIWKKPVYIQTAKMPRIPTETKINSIIAHASKKVALALSMSKDTGLRPVELMSLKLRDVDLVKGAVYPTTAKHGSPRVLKLTNTTLNMLSEYVASKQIGINDNLFGLWDADAYGARFRGTRNNLAKKLNDETIKGIRLYDLRHFFATMLYHRTKDILFVSQQLGHRNIKNTLKYTQLAQFADDDAFTTRVAQTVEQDRELIENGFEFITERDGLKIYRKRK